MIVFLTNFETEAQPAQGFSLITYSDCDATKPQHSRTSLNVTYDKTEKRQK